jgi:anti-sigma factor (TIGR02949 family)
MMTLWLVQEFLDGELDGVSNTEVEAHFEMCRQCYPHLRLERRFRAAVQRAGAGEVAPAGLRAQVIDMVAVGQSDA